MKFKKLVSVFTAFACAAVLSAPLGTAAEELEPMSLTTYDPCDVDHDGQVDILDVITINRHLSGNYYVPNYNQLDTNQNLIVDSADVSCVMAKIMGDSYSACFLSRESPGSGEISFSSISGFTPDAHTSLTASRDYVKYTYGSMPSSYTGNYLNNYLTTYTLTPTSSPLTAPGENSIMGQVGNTNDIVYATNLPENTGIVQISRTVEYFDNDGVLIEGRTKVATGFIIDNHTIATAAHCVYNDFSYGINEDTNVMEHTKERFYTPIIKTYNSNGSLSTQTLTPVEVHIPEAYRNSNDDLEYDYALITVSDDLSNYVHFSLGNSYNILRNKFNYVPIYVTGRYTNTLLGTDEGSVLTSYNGITLNNGILLRYNIDTVAGQSGSPVYTITKQTIDNTESYIYTALAIHNHTSVEKDTNNHFLYNQGTRITKYLTQFYLGNSHISYATNTQ